MAELSSLIHQLRERISASSSSSASASQAANNGVDDQFENRFRSILPNLLLQPEFRLLEIKLKIGMEINFCSHRQFLLDAMLLIEDLLYVASIFADSSTMTVSPVVSLQCLHKSFVGISGTCFRPTYGLGILIDLTDNQRWQPFATWTLKIISKCLTEGTLNVEGLTMACTLLCYGDAASHMACFDFPRVLTTVSDAEIVPMENLVRSILSILGHNEKEHPTFRSTVYDSWICLSVQVLSKIGLALKPESVLEILDLALGDEAKEVKVEAVIPIPMIVLCPGLGVLPHMLRRLEILGKENCSNVNRIVPFSLGYLSCLYGSVYANSAATCKLFLIGNNNKKNQTTDILGCPKCDIRDVRQRLYSFPMLKTRSQWIRCLEFVLHKKKRSVRESFRGQISCFLEIPILTCLFGYRFLDKLKHALAAAKEFEVSETLLELDNPRMVVRKDESRLIKRSCYFHQHYDYLCARVVNYPAMIREFAETVVGAQMEHFFKQMVPVVLPVSAGQRSSICHTMEIGSSNKEVFGAALPALLDELVCFQGDGDSNETTDRQALERIEMLIELMGVHLSTYVPKIMVLLIHAVDKETLQLYKDELRDIVDGLNHESMNVRYMAACDLRKLLNLWREDVTTLISGEAGSDLDVLISLITLLLRGCTEQSRTTVGQRLKLVCADCFGALGAVDPATVKGITCERFKIECSDDDLIFELIHKHLAKAFRAAPTIIVAKHHLMVILELKEHKSQKGKEVLNVSLSGSGYMDDIREMNKRRKKLWGPFQFPNVANSTTAGLIYQSSMSLGRWVFFWIRKLTGHSTGSRATKYLLPYLVLNAACHCTAEARLGITEEILSAIVNGVMGRQREVCIQAVFTLLDSLGQWVDDVKQEVALSQSLHCSKQQSSKSSGQNKDPPSEGPNELLIQFNNVSELLAAIPKVTLTKASFPCKAYARALLYYESHVLERSGSFNPAAQRSGMFEDEDVSILMEIYSGLDEPDGLSGLAHLRKSLSLDDQLLLNKRKGTGQNPLLSRLQRHSDVLNCLLYMCQLQAMVTAWRLGRWDLIDEYISGDEGLPYSSSESNACFDMDVAKILQAMSKKYQFSVAEKIAVSKQALLAPFAASGMNSYIRAYPFVVKLHMLSQLEDFHRLLVNDSFLEKSYHLDDRRFKKPLLALWRLVFIAIDLDAHYYIFVQFSSLIDHLIRLCSHPGQPKARTINISTEFSFLKQMMLVGIIMPIQPALTDPSIDGVERPLLCNLKDDLRKDARMVEFVRRRKLYIRTFAVIPLTEDCGAGIVEWVPHTRILRHILQDILNVVFRAIGNIQARLQGIVVGVGAAPSLRLGVEGQAHCRIGEAILHRNLGKMYVWWMPWFWKVVSYFRITVEVKCCALCDIWYSSRKVFIRNSSIGG
ncbi:hypothetical protein MKW92_025362 [Papaver armeniacum]|nr:hypothetical protein MKW92_025362 [Papaver armeniacum]